MAFPDNQNKPTQEHFTIVEIDLPIITGTCQLQGGGEGYGTQLSCPVQDGTSAVETKTYRFATKNTPLLPISPLYRCIEVCNEDATRLKSGEGLAVRGGGNVTFTDFKGDPNLERASARAIKNQGTFFGKFQSRNSFSSFELRVRKYRKGDNVDLVTPANDDGLVTYYTTKDLQFISNDKWRLGFNDLLSKVNFDKTEYPPSLGSLAADIDDTVTSFTVNGATSIWTEQSTPYVIKIGDELLTVSNVVDLGGDQSTLTVRARGSLVGNPDFADFISNTVAESHSANDEVLVCRTFSGVGVQVILNDILTTAGIDSSNIPLVDWQTELDTWLPNNVKTMCFYEQESVDKALARVLNGFMIDMWYEPIDQEVKISTVNNWKESSGTLTEGKEIDYQTLTVKQSENRRYSRAAISYNKTNLTDPDEASSFKQTSLAIRADIETPELYPEVKLFRFDNNHLIKKDDADLTTARYAQRYGFPPEEISWITQERFMTFRTGQVFNLNSPSIVGFDGLPDTSTRTQIIQIQLVNANEGRYYRVNALTYQPTGLDDLVIPEGEDINLHILFGAPSAAGAYTVIFDGGTFCGSSTSTPSVIAGAFDPASQLVIILRNGADWQAKGGNGADGQQVSSPGDPNLNGENGGTCYDAQGINTDIYLSGADPLGGTASGFLRAPGGGGGNSITISQPGPSYFQLAGGGGAGCRVGNAGATALNAPAQDGDLVGNGGDGAYFNLTMVGGPGGDWGQPGGNSGGLGGAAGKGIVKNGAVVNVCGDTPTNFINGGGDTPDQIAQFLTQDGLGIESQNGDVLYVNQDC